MHPTCLEQLASPLLRACSQHGPEVTVEPKLYLVGPVACRVIEAGILQGLCHSLFRCCLPACCRAGDETSRPLPAGTAVFRSA